VPDFSKYAGEMLELLDVMLGEKPMSTKRYSMVENLGVKDMETGVMLLPANEGFGTTARIVHPKLKTGELKAGLSKIGYVEKKAEGSMVSYELERGVEGLPDIVAVDALTGGLCTVELRTQDRKKVLTPLKNVVERLAGAYL